MARKFALVYAAVVRRHVHAIESKYHSLIRKEIESQLQVEPDKETRNRKPLRRPVIFGATWEIRFGPHNRFRVFYRVNRLENQVEILAIGIKDGDRLIVGREEIEL